MNNILCTDSFDLMRKEQGRAIQEKKRIISGEHEESINTETTIFLEDAGGDERLTNKYCNLKEFELSLASNSDMEGCKTTWITSSTQILPGFTSKSLEYDLNSSSTSHPPIKIEVMAGTLLVMTIFRKRNYLYFPDSSHSTLFSKEP